jgi:hypothetical protein
MISNIKWSASRDSETNIVSHTAEVNGRGFVISRVDVIGEGWVVVLNDRHIFKSIKTAKEYVARLQTVGF